MVRRPAILLLAVAALAFAVASTPGAGAQQETVEGSLLLIMDASHSMTEDDGRGRPRLQGAKEALLTLVDELPDDARVGLRVYGHRQPNTDPVAGCQDTELIHPVGPLDRDVFRAAIASYQASGYTPIGLSLQQAVDDLPAQGKRTVVLVSDGEDTCRNPPACDAARAIAARGIDLRVEVIGFQVEPAARADLACIAQATGGSYRDADDADALADELVTVSVRAFRGFVLSGQPVRGGGSYREAPVLAAGHYQDAIYPDEVVWFAVELDRGQRATFSATAPPVTSEYQSGWFEIERFNPTLEEICCSDSVLYEGRQPASMGAEIGPVGEDSDWEEPGTYYLRLTLDSDDLVGTEVPFELIVDVAGTPLGEGGLVGGGAPGGDDQPAAADRDLAGGDEDDGGLLSSVGGLAGLARLLVIGLVAGLLGAGVGALAVRAVRR